MKYGFCYFNDETNYLDDLLSFSWYKNTLLNVKLFCFYSPKNLIICFGWENKKPFFLNTNKTKNKYFIDQKSNLTGKVVFQFNKYYIKNLFGWAAGGKGGLLSLSNILFNFIK